MRSLTLAIDEDVLRRARIRALGQGTSVNGVLRGFLETYAGGGDARAGAVADLLRMSREASSGRGRRRWTREDLHTR